MMKNIFNQVDLLQKGLDASWKRNEVVANNIANADTPGFKASHVEFESVFQKSLEADSDSFFSSSGAGKAGPVAASAPYEIVTDKDSAVRMDGNSVDVDAEMTELAENTILYNALSYSVSKEFGRLKTVINEGK